jgi:uncharacterized coiled-coil protein SlyX
LELQLRDRDKQLEEQAQTLSEFQQSIAELEGGLDGLQVRAQLREKNEKIASLTAEFDSHRADFRSTLDTLEVAASETERVYEKRIEELLQTNRELQERAEDVEAVAMQLKQLEDHVSELEEGLEDARRGEAEARGEVEFLRGEVERTKLELKQEKERTAAILKEAGLSSDGLGGRNLTKDLDQKDDEIRGLKAIIHSLSRGDPSSQLLQQNGMASGNNADAKRRSQLEQRIHELESLNGRQTHQIEELERQLGRPQNASGARGRATTVTTSPLNLRKAQQQAQRNSNSTTHSHTLSDRTIVPPDWNEAPAPGTNPHTFSPAASRQLPTMQESDSRSSSTDDGGALWCEICETSGHDILTCTNMFGSGASKPSNDTTKVEPPTTSGSGRINSGGTVGGLGLRTGNGLHGVGNSTIQRTGREAVLEGLKGIGGGRLSTSMSAVAGKSSGIIDESKWCALCERDGHESIDCPFED